MYYIAYLYQSENRGLFYKFLAKEPTFLFFGESPPCAENDCAFEWESHAVAYFEQKADKISFLFAADAARIPHSLQIVHLLELLTK